MKINNANKPQYPFPIQMTYLTEIFHDCSDFMVRQISIGENPNLTVSFCWMDGLSSGSNISNDILRPLTSPLRFDQCSDFSEAFDEIHKGAVHNFTAKAHSQTDDVVSDLLNGSCALIFDTLQKAITFEAKSTFMRSVDQSTLEKSIKGSKEAFIENIRVNTCLVRRKMKTPKLKNISLSVGEKSDTFLSILYIEGVARFDIVSQLQDQISQLEIDGLLVPGYLEQYITQQPRSPFPQLLHTERPDSFASMLLEGRVGLLVDGLPVGFLVPAPLSQFMKVTEDTAQHFAVASMLLMLRYLALLVGSLLPGLYVAIAMYHQEMIPTEMLSSVITAKQQVPFSTAVEMLLMLVAFELLQEAGLRLPNPVGDTVSIIGALIVGQAAVDARVVSPIAVIIVAFSGISSYTMPSQDLASAIRLLRFAVVLAAMAAGIFGLSAIVTLVIWHLCTIESYEVSYLHPFVDSSVRGWMQSLLRQPLWSERFRDQKIAGADLRKQK